MKKQLFFSLLITQFLLIMVTNALSQNPVSRRAFVGKGVASVLSLSVWETIVQPANAAGDKVAFDGLLSQIQQARNQMDKIPAFIDAEKWDAVRAVGF